MPLKKSKAELVQRREYFIKEHKLLEEQRITQRTQFDIEMMNELGYCSGIENYSRYLSGRNEGEPPPTLFDYMPSDAILIIDESHVTVPQLAGCIVVTVLVKNLSGIWFPFAFCIG